MVVQDYSIKHVFINRKKEIETLKSLMNEVSAGSGQIVTIQGEHGIGKTKLIEEFQRLVSEEQSDQTQFLYGRCRRTPGRDPYQPFTEALHYKLPTTTDDIIQDKRLNPEINDDTLPMDESNGIINNNEPLKNGSTIDTKETIDPFIGAKPLGLIPIGEPEEETELDLGDETLPAPEMRPEVKPLPMGLIPTAFRTTEVDDIKRRRTDLYDTITNHLLKLASNSSVVLFIDDFQWINPASIGYLQYLTERIPKKPIMLVLLICLDELSEMSEGNQKINELLMDLESYENYTSITLTRFDINDVSSIVKEIFSRQDVPEDLIEQIYNKTEGNPLFIEDLIRSLIEDDIIDSSSYVWQTRIDVTQIKIPESTRETLISRIRKFDKDVVKVLSYAAVIGREFTFDLLATLTEIPKEALLDYIDIILESKLVKEDLASDEDAYRFNNPIILDIAYSQLSRSRRRFLHTKIGNIIEQQNINDVGKVVFTLANHYSKGWEYDKALKYLILAGDSAIQVYAIDDARRYYLSALETLNKFDYTLDIQQREIELLSNLGYTCQMLGDWDQALEYYSNIPKLIDSLQNKIISRESGEVSEAEKSQLESIPSNWIQLKLADTYWNLAELMRLKSSWEKAEQYYKRSLKLSQKIDDYHGIAQAERGRGYIHWRQGSYNNALDHYDICIDFATKINDLPVIAVTYIDIGNIYNYLGEWEQAIAYYTESIEHLSKIGWLHEMGRAYNGLGEIFAKQKNWEKAIENFVNAEDISKKIGDSYKRGYALFSLGECYAHLQELEKAEENCQLAQEILSRLDDRAGLAAVFRNFGIINNYKKDWTTAEDYFKRSLELLKDLKVPYESGHTYMEYGLMLRNMGNEAEAQKCLEYSLEIFRNMDAKGEIKHLDELLKTSNISTEQPEQKEKTEPVVEGDAEKVKD